MISDYERPHIHTRRGSENSALLRGKRKIGVRVKITTGILNPHKKINQSLRKDSEASKWPGQYTEPDALRLMHGSRKIELLLDSSLLPSSS